ncbi:radical SAM/SPASM domain-containing protein [Hymenobacter persicinus]|uniref:SPASM domain-containing protein n=1 Tax=Hymenobacter persicinus TaxID=2025506 RepID=A0A4Q5L9T8_9BACT|nr:radical SAM protein [Hymenobacter persicinus]RYU77665.1 SPASM domain-containing protein [Hymenobacter persicinus]
MDFKRSFYTVATGSLGGPVDDANGRVILYSTRTAKTHVLKQQHLAALDAGQFDLLPDTLFDALVEAEAIVPAHENELQVLLNRSRSAVDDSRTLNFVLLPSSQCQLGCDYCGQSHSKTYMKTDIYDQIVERARRQLDLSRHTELHVAWFGAEPLTGLAHIRQVSARLMALAAELGIGYSAHMVTNGLSLKKAIFEELFEQCQIRRFEITLDGDAESHDARRHTKEGEKTFDLILKNIVDVTHSPVYAGHGQVLSVRCNVDRRNIDRVIPLIELLASKGLNDKIRFYTAPVYSWGNDAHLLSLEKAEYGEREIDFLIAQMQNGFKLATIPGLNSIVCIAVSKDAEVIDSQGQIYNCTEIPLVPLYESADYLLGNVRKQPEVSLQERAFHDWPDQIESNKALWCSSCRMLPVCGGACPKAWREGNPPCPPAKANIEDRLALAYVYAKDGFATYAD